MLVGHHGHLQEGHHDGPPYGESVPQPQEGTLLYILFSLVQVQIQSLNHGFGPKLTLNCHSPTQPKHELELDLIMGSNPPHTTTTTGTFKALPGNLGS